MLRTHHLIPPLRHLPSGSGVCQVSARHSSSLQVTCVHVFRVVCLGRLSDPSKAGLVVAAARRLIEEEPHVRRREVATGLRIIENLPPHAHYSWIFDFEDEDGWRAYMSGEPHHRFAEVVTPYDGTSSMAPDRSRGHETSRVESDPTWRGARRSHW